MESRNENQDPSQNEQDQLSLLPDDIKRRLCTLLDGKSLSSLKLVSKKWASIISDDTTKVENGKTLKEIYTDKLNNDLFWKSDPLRNLLSYTALGDWKAKEIWEKDPSLLKRRGTVYHPNRIYDEKGNVLFDIPADQNPGRYKYVDVTPFQIALMNEEWEMAAEMIKYMDADEVEKQFLEVFPNKKIMKYDWDGAEAKKRLRAVFDAVINDTSISENNLDIMNESTRSALNHLYLYVKPIPEHRIGLVFDANIYARALKLYEEKFGDFKNNNRWDQRSFWCIRVEEDLAGLLPTGYLRAHTQGILNRTKNTGCTLADNTSYYACRRGANSIPGFHFFVGLYGGAARPRGHGRVVACCRITPTEFRYVGVEGPAFGKFMSSKNESRDRLYAAICAHRSIVMSDSLK